MCRVQQFHGWPASNACGGFILRWRSSRSFIGTHSALPCLRCSPRAGCMLACLQCDTQQSVLIQAVLYYIQTHLPFHTLVCFQTPASASVLPRTYPTRSRNNGALPPLPLLRHGQTTTGADQPYRVFRRAVSRPVTAGFRDRTIFRARWCAISISSPRDPQSQLEGSSRDHYIPPSRHQKR